MKSTTNPTCCGSQMERAGSRREKCQATGWWITTHVWVCLKCKCLYGVSVKYEPIVCNGVCKIKLVPARNK